MRARVRGIYATALTRLLVDDGHGVAQASRPIRERFDADAVAGDGVSDVRLVTTDDRQGVTVAGGTDAVAAATDACLSVGVDALGWEAAAPRDAVFDARVTDTTRGGAICDLGDGAEGYLPFDAVDAHVEPGDTVRVQVAEPAPPWLDRRPRLDGTVRVRTGLATLVRGGEGTTVDTRDAAAAREVAGLLDLAGVEPPDGWGVEWSHAATEASVETLTTALERARERAATLAEALDRPVDAPRLVARPLDTRFVWFGRTARFALDAVRREVTPTMPGHHRTKAASEAASAGVDLAEALCAEGMGEEFPFGVVTDQFGPREGDEVAIAHGKPDGRLITLGRGEVVERGADGTLAVRREMTAGGTYDALGAPREAGDTALTKVREGRWWYPTVYRDAEGASKGTYVNVCTPVECYPDAVRYVDLHVDVVKHADGRVERVDDDELDAAVAAGEVPAALADRARSVAASIESAL
ncbi:MAG: DUF402 domain-containing protein [Haloferacaceae archaeon]